MKLFGNKKSTHLLEIDISGMTCSGCSAHVVKGLQKAKGIESVEIKNWSDSKVTVYGSEEIDPIELISMIEKMGYKGRTHQKQKVYREASFRHKESPADYDVVIIGSGGAGMAAALTLAGAGKKVAIIEAGVIGGTCVNVGCVPSKTLLRAAEAAHHAKQNPFAGVKTKLEGVDWHRVLAQKDELVAELREQKYVDIIRQNSDNITMIKGRATLESSYSLKVDDERMITFNQLVIGTGSRPRHIEIPGSVKSDFLNSTELLEIKEIPKELIVLGGRFIALELSQIFSRLGGKVTVVQRGEKLISDNEPEISEAIQKAYETEGIRVLTGAVPVRLEKKKEKKILEIKQGDVSIQLESTAILQAVGRVPNSDLLGLEKVGIEVDNSGAIIVNERFQTNKEHIYAAGDVTTKPSLVYVAAKAGTIVAKTILGKIPSTEEEMNIDLRILPEVIFSDPQIARVGYTEKEAIEKGFDVKTSVLPMEYVPRSIAARKTEGLIKLVADKKTDILLGAHVMGAEAGEVIQTAALAIKMGYDYGFKVNQLKDLLFPYLTQVEGLKLAAQTFDKDVKTLSCCAG